MAVDLLRANTVPISPDTVLWFEFLLDQSLLEKHLSKPNPDPSWSELVIKYLTLRPQPVEAVKPQDIENPDSPTLSIVETEKLSMKQLSMKIVSLRIAAYLKWNLTLLENSLPPQIQSQLMQDLVFMASDGLYSNPPHDINDKILSQSGVKFAFVLYYRWLLRFLVNRANIRTPKHIQVWMGAPLTDITCIQVYDNLVAKCEDSRKRAINFLTEVVEKPRSDSKDLEFVSVPSIDSFAFLTEDSEEMIHNWETGNIKVNENEFFMQINYDLCANYFFYGQYESARKHISLCNENKERLIKETEKFDWSDLNYANVTEQEITGYMKALNISQESKTLLHQLHEAVANQYEGLIYVLQEDNIKREIPMVHRTVVELDIQGISSSGTATVSRDLLNKVAALNVVRSLLDGNLPSTHIDFNKRMKAMGAKFVDVLFWAFAPVLKSSTLSKEDYILVKQFFLYLATSEHNVPIYSINEFLKSCEKDAFFTKDEIEVIVKDLHEDTAESGSNFPIEILSTGWELPDFNTKNIPELDLGCLKQRLIDATTAEKIKDCLVSIALTNPAQPTWTVNPQWKLPIPLQSVIKALPRGFLQDFCYVIMGKARQQAEMGEYASALQLLWILESETYNQYNQSDKSSSSSRNLYKLWKLVGWEALFYQINNMLVHWPNQKENETFLVKKSVACILALQSGNSVIPRMEIIEQCYICLLNEGEWKRLAELAAGSRGTGQAEAAVATALAAHHLRTEPMKKLPEDLWDMVVPIFVNMQSSSSTKRSSSGSSISSRDAGQTNNKMKDGMTSFFSKLRDPTVLSVVISLLAKLFNIQKDDSNMDLNMEYINMWPAKVSSTISLSMVSNSLHQLVTQALKYYPNNISWIKLLGDMSLVGGHYSIAMKQYLTALTILSDNFVQPLSKQLIEDQTIFKRMIKCCTQLNCPTQAALLCQFLEEIDYVLAFKCLSEMSHLCSDAMDSYYGCIWDTSILEYLINLHHKRGETHRKQLAVKVMGMLELNSNNNEEIQREAANKRKAKFMRALVKQYVC